MFQHAQQTLFPWQVQGTDSDEGVTPFQVLLKEEALTDARLTLATAATALRQSEASFWRAVGMLGEQLGVGGGR